MSARGACMQRGLCSRPRIGGILAAPSVRSWRAAAVVPSVSAPEPGPLPSEHVQREDEVRGSPALKMRVSRAVMVLAATQLRLNPSSSRVHKRLL